MIFFSFRREKVSVMKARKRKPGPRRLVTSTYRRQEALNKQMANAVKVDLVRGIKTFKKKVSARALEEAWRSGDYSGLERIIPWDGLPGDLDPAVKGIYASASGGAAIQLAVMPPNINKNLRFDTSQPYLKSYLKDRSANLVKYITEDSRKVIRASVTNAFNNALSPRQVADEIKGSIGLLPSHAAALKKYTQSLIYEKKMPLQNVIAYSAAYQERLLDYRAMTIARTEVKNAINHGMLAVWKSGADQGLIDAATAQKEWVVDGDPCPICEPMDEVRVGIDESWTIELLNGQELQVEIPSQSHPNCYCGMELHFGKEESDEGNGEENEDEN